ncbi:hypothetical protein TNCV_302561 [Trichonephila clavipes]|nr:hypothetical protein TNCV_302561 [Trichonephila clavipes]
MVWQVLWWDVEDDDRNGRPSTSTNENNIIRIQDVVLVDRSTNIVCEWPSYGCKTQRALSFVQGLQALQESTRTIGDLPRNFEPTSSDEDDTLTGNSPVQTATSSQREI